MSDKNKPQAHENQNQNETNENLLDLNIVIDELLNLILKENNRGSEEKMIKKCVLNYINNHKIILQEIYSWLLNNQNHSSSTYLLGYFNYHGIETNINTQNAFDLYQKAANLGNSIAQSDLANMYKNGEGVNKDYIKAFELYQKSAKDEDSYG